MALNEKQARFVQEYLKDLNATAAYIRAGYAARGKAAEASASRLLSNAKVKKEIAKARAKHEDRTGVTVARVVQEAARVALFDPRKLFNEDGTPKSIIELDDDTAAAIGGLKVKRVSGDGDEECTILEYKVVDKNAALEKLFRHLGAYEKDNAQTNPITSLLASIGKSSLPVIANPEDEDGDE